MSVCTCQPDQKTMCPVCDADMYACANEGARLTQDRIRADNRASDGDPDFMTSVQIERADVAVEARAEKKAILAEEMGERVD